MSGLLPELHDARFDERAISRKDVVWREIGAQLQRPNPIDTHTVDAVCDCGHSIRSLTVLRVVVRQTRFVEDAR